MTTTFRNFINSIQFRHVFLLTAAFAFTVMLTAATTNENPAYTPDDELFSKTANDVVYYVPQFSEFEAISTSEMTFLKKVLKQAADENVKAVIFELDTPGGRVDVAIKYLSILSKSQVPVIAYVNPHGISAGMIIALSADRAAINPNGTIGDAMPMAPGYIPVTEKRHDKEEKKEDKKSEDKDKTKDDSDKAGKAEDKKDDKEKPEDKKNEDSPSYKKILKELEKLNRSPRKEEKESDDDRTEQEKLKDQKFLTFFFGVLKVLAQKNNRPERVIRAMADPYQKLSKEKDGIEHTKTSPLTLTAGEAKKLHVVDYISRDKEQLLEQLKLDDCEVKIIEKSAQEQVAGFLGWFANPVVSGLLLILGITGIYIEIRTPGFGVPGILGVSLLALFFVSHIMVGHSGWGPPVLFFLGLILLSIEVFVIPGFGFVGILGIACILGSLFMAFGLEDLQQGIYVVGGATLVTTILLIVLTVWVLPNSTLFNRLKLETVQNTDEGYSSHQKRDSELVDKVGVAYTTLRPTGTAMIEGKRYDVVTDGDFIEKGSDIKVIEVKGMQVVVTQADIQLPETDNAVKEETDHTTA